MAPKDTITDLRLYEPSLLLAVLAPIVEFRAFLVWMPRQHGDHLDKVPVDPKTGEPQGTNSARERGVLTFREAVEAADRLMRKTGRRYGIGLVPAHAGDDIIALDLDKAVNFRGELRASLAAIVGTPSEVYAEFSPSGLLSNDATRSFGLRALMRVDPAEKDRLLADIGNGREIGSIGAYFGDSKFVTITGHAFDPDVPLELRDGTGALTQAVQRMRELAAAMPSGARPRIPVTP